MAVVETVTNPLFKYLRHKSSKEVNRCHRGEGREGCVVLNRATQAAPDTTKLPVLIAEERSSFKFHHLRIKNYSAWTVLKSKPR